MNFFMQSMVVLAQWGLASSLEAGDCAFVGAYGDKDDFALVLLEDANEQIYITDEILRHWRSTPVGKWVEAKEQVKDAKRGAVLRKSDFQMQETSLIAPVALTAFKGSPASPEVLCSISMSGKGSANSRLLNEANLIELDSDSAEYMGSTAGTKAELIENILDMSNWRNGLSRQLRGFTVAMGGNQSDTMTTSMNPNPNMTVTETTTMEDDDDDTTNTDGSGGPSPPPPPPPPPSSTTPGKTDSNAAATSFLLGAMMLVVRLL